MAKKTENDLEQEQHEKEARISALRQLLQNSHADIMAGYEGLIPQAEFDELKEQRRKWFAELAELTDEQVDSGTPMTTDIIDLIENIEAGEYDAVAIKELKAAQKALSDKIDELEPGGAFPESKYTPEEIVGAVEGLIDGLVGG